MKGWWKTVVESHSGCDFLQRCVFNFLLNVRWLASSLTSSGRLFHVPWPAALKEPCLSFPVLQKIGLMPQEVEDLKVLTILSTVVDHWGRMVLFHYDIYV